MVARSSPWRRCGTSGKTITAEARAASAEFGFDGDPPVPRQANLVAVAKMLRIDPRALQYGDPDGRNIREPGKAWKVTAADQLAIDAFLALPSAQRKAIRDLIATLARAQATAA